jgi:hypothetical protein
MVTVALGTTAPDWSLTNPTMVPTSDCAKVAIGNNRLTEIASATNSDLAILAGLVGFTGGQNFDAGEEPAEIAGNIPLLDIRGLSQTKDCSGAMLCAYMPWFGRGLPGVYTGDLTGEKGQRIVSPRIRNSYGKNCLAFTWHS